MKVILIVAFTALLLAMSYGFVGGFQWVIWQCGYHDIAKVPTWAAWLLLTCVGMIIRGWQSK